MNPKRLGYKQEEHTADQVLETKQAGDPAPKAAAPSASSSSSAGSSGGLGAGLYAIIVVGGALAYFAYSYLQSQSETAK